MQGTLTASLTYDDAGRRTKLVLPYGVNVLYSYDAASRLTNITYQGLVTNKIDYAYDAVGSRVAQASLPVGFANYNLPAAVNVSSYNAANQQLTFGSYNLLYDANGNVTNIVNGTVTNDLVWSARNQLTNMLGAVTASFIYDGLGRRVSRKVDGPAQQYTYDGLDTIMEHRGGVLKFLYFRGLGIDEPWHQARIRNSSPISTNNVVYLADALGSIVAMTDSNRNVVTEYDYEPFGATTTTGAAITNSYKFTGREDDGTGLYYYRARYYHPALGRFVSEDPFRFLARPNFYAYVKNVPVRLRDPLGLQEADLDFEPFEPPYLRGLDIEPPNTAPRTIADAIAKAPPNAKDIIQSFIPKDPQAIAGVTDPFAAPSPQQTQAAQNGITPPQQPSPQPYVPYSGGDANVTATATGDLPWGSQPFGPVSRIAEMPPLTRIPEPPPVEIKPAPPDTVIGPLR